MTMFKFQYLIIFSVCLYWRFSHGFPSELLCNGAKIVTYGEPCYPIRYLSGKVEEPVQKLTLCKVDQPLRLNYRTIYSKSVPSQYHPHQLQIKYPITVEVPQVPQSLEIIRPDLHRGKSYEYNVQVPPSPNLMPILKNYNFDVQVPLPPPTTTIPTYTTRFLTDLTSKVDKILIPACELPALNDKPCERTSYV